MRHLLNTLFITSEDAYLSLEGENVLVNREKIVVARFPLHTLSGILSFSYAGASPALMGACAKRDINLAFCSPRGKFLARTAGITVAMCCFVGSNIGWQMMKRKAVRSPAA